MYLPLHCPLHRCPLGSDGMHVLVAEVYSDSGSVSLVMHSGFAEVDGHSDSEVVGVAVVASSVVMAASVGSGHFASSIEVLAWVDATEACCLVFY